jgi:hypothetical protein
MLKLQSLSSGLRSSLQRQALSTANLDLHYSSRGKNWRKQYDPGYFYDGVDLGPSVGRVNIRDFKFDKYCVRNLTRLRLVDNSKLSTAAMEYWRKPRVLRSHGVNQGVHLGARHLRGARQYPTKEQHAGVGDLVQVSANHQIAWGVIVGGKVPLGQYKNATFKSRQDQSQAVLLNEEFEPLGNRINVPLPGWLRYHNKSFVGKKIQYNKLFAISAKGFY